MKNLMVVCAFLIGCPHPVSHGDAAVVSDSALLADGAVAPGSTLEISNDSKADTVVFFAFGADSVITNWSFCPTTTKLNCQFPLAKGVKQELPLGGKYLNATLSFDAPVSCNSTKGELNLNNPKWYDIVDISLVDGYSNKFSILVGNTKLGPPRGKAGNEKVLGLYPLGCDICVARQKPPCDMTPGKGGCKAGPDQYHPKVPCQWQGTVKGGGTAVKVSFLGK